MFYILNTFTCHTYEVSWTKEIEQQRQAYRWEEGTVSSAVISKGVNALSNRYSALEEKISMNTKAITNICEELKGVEIKVSKKKKKKRKKTSEKKKKQPHVRLQRKDDAVGYSKKWHFQLYGIWDSQCRCMDCTFLNTSSSSFEKRISGFV